MEAPRLTAVVVLPTPPFWFATARTLPMPGLKLRGGPVGRACLVLFASERLGPACVYGSNEGWAGLVGGFHTKRRYSRRFVWNPSLLVVRARSTQRPLRRHPGPPRKPVGRGRNLPEHVE